VETIARIRRADWKTPNPEIQTPKIKLQTPEKFQITSSKAATSRAESGFGAWDFFGVWSLVFGVFILAELVPPKDEICIEV